MSSANPDQPLGVEAESTGGRARWVALGVFLIIAVFVVILASRPAANSTDLASPLVGQPAPNIAGTALDGRSVDLSSMRGRYVVVNFFATWCGPCIAEHPELETFSRRHPGDAGPAVIAVAFRDANSNVRAFFEKNGGTWPVVPDETGEVGVSYGVRGLPESYVVDPEGNIAARINGQVTADALDSLTGGP